MKVLAVLFSLGIIIFVSIPLSLIAQNDYPLDIKYYSFISYEKNKFIFPGDSADFERFYSKMDSIMLNGNGKITIVHIGGSHIQADIYSGHTRERLQTFFPGMNGGRGMIFPYRISKTNNPGSYYTTSSGEWLTCRNVENNNSCNLGLSGITAITADSLAYIDFFLKPNSQNYTSFTKIRIFHSMDSLSYCPKPKKVKVIDIEVNKKLGYSIFYLDKEYNSFQLKLDNNDSIQNHFELYGVSLENDDSGIVYHSIGINGASFSSFLKCNLLENQLAALNPDLVILSLGTNDAYTTKFNPEFYKSNYQQMIIKIRNAAPHAAILNTVANDSYLFRRYPNKNTKLAEEVIYQVAEKNNCGIWDFYQIMGGFNSSSVWYKQHLMLKDKIHFNTEGYLLIGDLLFNAFIQSYNNHLDSIIRN